MMARSVVGVTVHDDVLRGMEIKGDRPRTWGEVALPAGVIDQGVVVDTAAFATSLRQLWSSAGFSSKRVAFAIEAEATTIRRVSLPGAVADDIAEAAAYDIAEILTYPAIDAVIDYAVLNADAKGTHRHAASVLTDDSEEPPIEALVVAVPRQTIDSFTEATKLAGLRWVRCELAPAATIALLPKDSLNAAVFERGDQDPHDQDQHDQDKHDQDQDHEVPGPSLGAVVSIGDTTTTVAVHDGEGLLFARVLTTGVGRAASISHELESQLAEVESIRAGGRGPSDTAYVPSNDAPGVSVVAEGIRRTLLFHTSDIDKRPIDHVVLCGSRSRANGLLNRVAEALPAASVTVLEHQDWPSVEQPERFDTAFGVARLIQTAHIDHLRDLSLVPASVTSQRQDVRAASLGAVVAAAFALLAFGSHQDRAAANDMEEAAAVAAEVSVDRVRAEVARFGDERALAAEVEQDKALVEALASGRVAIPSLIGRLAEAMPTNSVLRSVRISTADPEPTDPDITDPSSAEAASVMISGAAPDLEAVAAWVDSANASGVLTEVHLVGTAFGPFGTNEQDVAVFQVEARVAAEALVPLPPSVSRSTAANDEVPNAAISGELSE